MPSMQVSWVGNKAVDFSAHMVNIAPDLSKLRLTETKTSCKLASCNQLPRTFYGWSAQKPIHDYGARTLVIAIYTLVCTTSTPKSRHHNSKPPFSWTDKDGLPMLLRGVSKVITTPELPTWPFHLDRPICHVGIFSYSQNRILEWINQKCLGVESLQRVR